MLRILISPTCKNVFVNSLLKNDVAWTKALAGLVQLGLRGDGAIGIGVWAMESGL